MNFSRSQNITLRKVYFGLLVHSAKPFPCFYLWFYFHCIYSLGSFRYFSFHIRSSSWAPDGILVPTRHQYTDVLQRPANTRWILKDCNHSYSFCPPNLLLILCSLLEESTTHPIAYNWTRDLLLDSPVAFTPAASCQVLTVLPACWISGVCFPSASHSPSLKATFHCFILW